MSDRTLLDRAGVARKLGYSVETFYDKEEELIARGMPQPILGNGRGARWDPVAIDRWFDRLGGLAPPPRADESSDDDDEALDALLEARARARAAGVARGQA